MSSEMLMLIMSLMILLLGTAMYYTVQLIDNLVKIGTETLERLESTHDDLTRIKTKIDVVSLNVSRGVQFITADEIDWEDSDDD